MEKTLLVDLTRFEIKATLEWIEGAIMAAQQNADPSWYAFRDKLRGTLQADD